MNEQETIRKIRSHMSTVEELLKHLETLCYTSPTQRDLQTLWKNREKPFHRSDPIVSVDEITAAVDVDASTARRFLKENDFHPVFVQKWLNGTKHRKTYYIHGVQDATSASVAKVLFPVKE